VVYSAELTRLSVIGHGAQLLALDDMVRLDDDDVARVYHLGLWHRPRRRRSCAEVRCTAAR
jgi:hypothetical protein